MVKLLRNGVETYDFNLKKGDLLEARVEKLVFGGQGIVRIVEENAKRGLVIFVEGVAPGDLVKLEVISLRHNLARGKVISFLQKAPERIEARCKHFGLSEVDGIVKEDNTKNCGGCSWQFLSYTDQLKVKWQEVYDSLARIGGLEKDLLAKLMKPVMGMEEPWYYRNKMEFSFTRAEAGLGKWQVGLHLKGRFYEVCEIEECHLFTPWIGKFLGKVRSWLDLQNFEEGTNLQSLYVRRASNTGEVLINLVFENGKDNFSESWLNLLEDFFEKERDGLDDDVLVSAFITQVINIKGQRKETREKILKGKAYFVEELRLNDGQVLKFQVSPQAFLQPNTLQAEKIYSVIGEMIFGRNNLANDIVIYDLFCGTGTIGVSLANRVKKIIGVELNASALQMAKQNAELNGAQNCEWRCADVAKVLKEILNDGSVVVVDPPRAGLGASVVANLVDSKLEKLIYVSCNPATLARDTRGLLSGGYKLKRIEVIDQFCHTYHVETICQFERS